MVRTTQLVLAMTIVTFLMSFIASAWAIANGVNYQGLISWKGGELLNDPHATLIFTIHDDKVNNAPLWTETYTLVPIKNGVFNIILGSLDNPLPNIDDLRISDLWLEIEYGGELMGPRQPLTNVVSAIIAQDADTVDGRHASTFAPTTHLHAGADITSGTVAANRISQAIARDTEITWANLSGVPAGFADGIDNTTSGSSGDGSSLDASDGDPIDAVYVDANGNVGIGTSAPVARITVNSKADDNVSQPVNGIIFTNDSYLPQNGPWAQAGIWSEGKTGYQGELVFGTDGDGTRNTDQIVEHMRITKDGKVGIGTANPVYDLEVKGSMKSSEGIWAESPLLIGVVGKNIAFQTTGRLGDPLAGVYGTTTFPGGQNYAGFFEGNVKVVGNLTVQGTNTVDVLEITGGADLSERFNVQHSIDNIIPTPGMLVSIDPQNPGGLSVSHTKYDRKVAGIISGANGVSPGMMMGQKDSVANGAYPVALSGRVYCLADASYGTIAPGDLLASSDTPGHAMKVSDFSMAQGAVLGKAMTGLESDKGYVLVLVALQ